MEPVVHLRGAVTLLGRFPALAGIDLDVAAGAIVLLRGPNGAGKTTLLRCCAGLLPLARGEGSVLGHDLTDASDRRRLRSHVGLLGHQSGLYEDLGVVDNIRFWGRAAGASEAEIAAAAALLGVDGRLAEVAVARLSAGQRRRAALACLVARRPRLWLLDEPHAGIDREGRDLVDQLVRSAVASGATVVLSSHELDRAEALADTVVSLDAGTAACASSGTDAPVEVAVPASEPSAVIPGGR